MDSNVSRVHATIVDPPDWKGQIKVLVTEVSGVPKVKREVCIVQTDQRLLLSPQLTGIDGRTSFVISHAGSFSVSCDGVTIATTLSKRQMTRYIHIVAEAKQRLSVIVTKDGEEPCAFAEIWRDTTLRGRRGERIGITGADGRLIVNGVTPNDFVFACSAESGITRALKVDRAIKGELRLTMQPDTMRLRVTLVGPGATRPDIQVHCSRRRTTSDSSTSRTAKEIPQLFDSVGRPLWITERNNTFVDVEAVNLDGQVLSKKRVRALYADEEVELSVAELRAVSFLVVDSVSSRGVSGATVFINQGKNSQALQTSRTGHVCVELAVGASAEIVAKHPKHGRVSFRWGPTSGAAPGERILVLDPGRRLEVNVCDEKGDAVWGAYVEVRISGVRTIASSRTGNNGKVGFTALPNEPLEVLVWRYGRNRLNEGTQEEVPMHVDSIDVSLPNVEGGVLSFLGMASTEFELVRLYLSRINGGPCLVLYPDSGELNRVDIVGLSKGRYRARAEFRSFSGRRTSRWQVVDLANENQKVLLRAFEYARLSIQPNVTVVLLQNGVILKRARAGSEHPLFVNVPPDTYTFRIFKGAQSDSRIVQLSEKTVEVLDIE